MTQPSAREFYGESAITVAGFKAATGYTLPEVACVQLDGEQVLIMVDEEGGS